MLESLVVQILLGMGFLLMISTLIYAKFNKGRATKTAPKPANVNRENTVGQYGIASRIGNVAGHLLILSVILNIFFFNFIRQYVPRLDFAVFSTPIQLIAFGCTIFGCGIQFVAFRTLGANWITSDQRDGRIPLPAEQKLIQTGIYKHIRNPVYLGNFFIVGGFAFLTLCVITFVLFVIQSVGFYYYALDEEKALLEHFGDEYARYFQRTGRFLPKHKRKNNLRE
jgi:protein-S-isoprenylcysteine O-methyltransferase Ste14